MCGALKRISTSTESRTTPSMQQRQEQQLILDHFSQGGASRDSASGLYARKSGATTTGQRLAAQERNARDRKQSHQPHTPSFAKLHVTAFNEEVTIYSSNEPRVVVRAAQAAREKAAA